MYFNLQTFCISSILWQESCRSSTHHVKNYFIIINFMTSFYQLHWPLVLVLRETEQSIPARLLRATPDFHGPLSCLLVLFLLPHWKISGCSIVLREEAIPYTWSFLLSFLFQPWGYTVAIYSSLSCSLLLLFLLPSSSHQIANFWVMRFISWLLKFEWDLLYNSSGVSQRWLQSHGLVFIPLKPQNYHILWAVTSKFCCLIWLSNHVITLEGYMSCVMYQMISISC